MRFCRGWVVVAMGLVACESSVDLCGSGAVCGTDGVTYSDTCELAERGATLDYTGMCTGECPPCDAVPCYGEPILDERGCSTCVCVCSPGDCPDGLDCVMGSCIPKDGGMTDAARPDANGCDIDIDCAPGVCRAGRCIFPCDETTADCDDDGSCETRLGNIENCTGCGDDCEARAPFNTAPYCSVDEGCQYPCVDGFARCGESEQCDSDLSLRPHCGGCDRACAFNEICLDGGCAVCEGLTRCGNSCIDIETDPSNCGACGSPCAADGSEACVAGNCIPTTCLDPDDPSWSCDGDIVGCTCSCGPVLQISILGGLVTCPLGLAGDSCVMDESECAAYDPHEVAACCLEP